jgi:hypothetical protein
MRIVGPRGYKHLQSLCKKLNSVIFPEQQKQAAHVFQECIILLIGVNYSLGTCLGLYFIEIFRHQVLSQLLVLQPQSLKLQLIFAILLPLVS